MTTAMKCNSCGKTIPADAPQGICPACVFGIIGSDSHLATAVHRQNPVPDIKRVIEAFPQLEILELIGSGGMGAVYRVRQVSLDRIAALKLLNMNLANDPAFQERFAREARLMARLVHPNIATIFEFGQAGEFGYLLMEMIDGVNLRSAIRTGKTSPEEALQIIPQVCDALQYAHDNGVIHRDVKPENILLDKYGRVKLVDFGLAKLSATHAGQPTLTGTQQVMGTMNYMAPEQLERKRKVDHRADIYSLGVVFYELLTGELPLGRFSVPSSKSGIDQRLDPVVLRTLEKDPDSRFQSASEVKTAVDMACDRHGFRPIGTTSSAQPAASPVVTRLASLPFKFGDDVNYWKSHGLALLDESGLKLEFARRARWTGLDNGVGVVHMKFSDINSVRIRNGPITKGIEIQVGSLECLGEFPVKDGQRLLLRTKSEDREMQDRLYSELCRMIGQEPLNNADATHRSERVRHEVQGPGLAMAFSGLLNIFIALVCLAAIAVVISLGDSKWFETHSYGLVTTVTVEDRASSIAAAEAGDSPTDSSGAGTGAKDAARKVSSVTGSPEAASHGPLDRVRDMRIISNRDGMFNMIQAMLGVLVLSVYFSVVGIFQLYCARQVRQLRKYWLGFWGFIVSLVPLHPGALIGIPGGIWGLVAMSRERTFDAFDFLFQQSIRVPPKPGILK